MRWPINAFSVPKHTTLQVECPQALHSTTAKKHSKITSRVRPNTRIFLPFTMDAMSDVSVISHGKQSKCIHGISNSTNFFALSRLKDLPDSSKPIDDQHRVSSDLRSRLEGRDELPSVHAQVLVHQGSSLVHTLRVRSVAGFLHPCPAPPHHCRCSFALRFLVQLSRKLPIQMLIKTLLFCVASDSEALFGFFPPPCETRPTLQTPSRELILLSRHSYVSELLQQLSRIGSSIKIKILSTHPNSPIFNARPFHEELVPRRTGCSNRSSFHSHFVTWINIVRRRSPCANFRAGIVFFLTPQCFI